MGIQAEIMDIAINEYLGTEDQWCTGTFARDTEGDQVDVGNPQATSHCAVGAIRAAVMTWTDRHVNQSTSGSAAVYQGVLRVLLDQHPDIEAKVPSDWKTHMGLLPMFNDGGHAELSTEEGTTVVSFPGIGYQGIRSAFEKYRAVCEEKDL